VSTRSDRLLALIQALRRHRRAISADTLARQLGVSSRTVYRDIQTLRTSGVDISGAAGVGFVLRDHAFLPPLAFSRAQADALALGLHFVQARGDAGLREAAADAMAKIRSVVAPDIAIGLALPALIAGPSPEFVREEILARIRAAIADERTLLIHYCDLEGRRTQRKVWPVLVGFMEQADLLAAWCELRGAMRHFRLDRIASAELLAQPYGRPRATLLVDWQRQQDGQAPR